MEDYGTPLIKDDWAPYDEPNLLHIENHEIDRMRTLLLGHRIKKIADDHLQLDDGTVVKVVPNSGCGGCYNGGYLLADLNSIDNIITSVEVVEDIEEVEDEPDRTYSVFVIAEHKQLLLSVEGTDGNGYYGTGYHLLVRGG